MTPISTVKHFISLKFLHGACIIFTSNFNAFPISLTTAYHKQEHVFKESNMYNSRRIERTRAPQRYMRATPYSYDQQQPAQHFAPAPNYARVSPGVSLFVC